MADYKLVTRVAFRDNTEAESPEELQKYVESIKDDCLDNWDIASVLLEVDGKEYRAAGNGNRHMGAGTSRLHNHPWHKASEGLGHDSEETTQIYLASIENSVVDKANSRIIGLLD